MQFEDSSLAPYQGSEPYIFLSYSHRDAEPAAEIIRGMNADGFHIWYDEGLVPGKEWDENIARAIVKCSYFIALMSRNYLASANCRDELNFARDKKLPILLLYLEDVELPAGMEMRLGRMLAIHTHKFLRKEALFAKIRAADGISLCREIPEGEEPEPPEEAPLPVKRSPARSPLSKALPIVCALFVLAGAALFFLLRGKKDNALPEPSAVPTAAAEVLSTEAPATPTPVPSVPAATETPAPAEVTEAPVPAEETEAPAAAEPEPTPTEEVLAPEELAYREAEALEAAGKNAPAALAFYKLGDYRDAAERSRTLWLSTLKRSTVSIGTELSAGLKEDGSLAIAGKLDKSKADVGGWGNLIAVAVGNEHTLGLLADGTVVSKGLNMHGERDVGSWRDIAAIVAGKEISFGLREDGTVIAAGENKAGRCNVQDWTDIVAVSVGEQHTVGLRRDGTVVSTGFNSNGQRNVDDWTDIVAVAAGGYHTLGLKSDGTVIAVGYNAYKQCEVSDWTDIVAIAAGKHHSVGLRADGTVVVAGGSSSVEAEKLARWSDVIEIDCGELSTIALRSDGTALACGENTDGKCNVEGWKNLRLPAHVLG